MTLRLGKEKFVACQDKCCRSLYRAGAASQAMNQAIDMKKVLINEEFKRVIAATHKLEDPHGLSIRFVAVTGCRLGEMLLMKSDQVIIDANLPMPYARVRTLKRKGRPIRNVDLQDKRFIKELQAHIKSNGSGQLFKVRRRTVQDKFSTILKALKIKKDTGIHILRHTRASQLVRAGAPWNYIRDQLGWVNLEMAKIYTHTEEKERRALAKRLQMT